MTSVSVQHWFIQFSSGKIVNSLKWALKCFFLNIFFSHVVSC